MRRLASTLLLATALSGLSVPASAQVQAPVPDKVVEQVRPGHSPARFVPTEPGRWVVSRIQMPAMPPYGWRLAATNGLASDAT